MEEKIKDLETIIFKLVRNKPLEDREKEMVERIVEKIVEEEDASQEELKDSQNEKGVF